MIDIFDKDRFFIIVNMKFIYSELLFRSKEKKINEIIFKQSDYIWIYFY
jgi:hypothetical protein